MIDAAEIARLRERLEFVGSTGTLGHVDPTVLSSLLDELEKARKHNDDFDANVNRLKACEHIAEGDEGWERLVNECPSTSAVARLRTERDSARALLREAVKFCDVLSRHPAYANNSLRARIQAELEGK